METRTILINKEDMEKLIEDGQVRLYDYFECAECYQGKYIEIQLVCEIKTGVRRIKVWQCVVVHIIFRGGIMSNQLDVI